MLVLLSPAKTMNMSLVEQDIPHTTPLYAAEAEFLAERMQKYSVTELARLLKVSDRLAEESFQRYRRFGSLSSPRKQAIIAYAGRFLMLWIRALLPKPISITLRSMCVSFRLYTVRYVLWI